MFSSVSLKQYLLEDLIHKAEIEMRGSNFVAALSLWRIAIKLFPRCGICYKGAALACMEIDEQGEAEGLCALAARFAEDGHEPLIIKAEIEQRRGNFLAALRLWAELREKFPACPEGYEHAARACLELGEYNLAAKLLDEQMDKSGDARELSDILAACGVEGKGFAPETHDFSPGMDKNSAELAGRKCRAWGHTEKRGIKLPDIMEFLSNDCQIYAVNIVEWKREFIARLFAGSRLTFLNEKSRITAYIAEIMRLISRGKKTAFLVWGMPDCKDVIFAARKFSIPLIRVEDGFIRSVGSGLRHIPPYSLCFDSKTMYFNCWRASDLENLISRFDEKDNAELIGRARMCMDFIVNKRITKYNVDVKTDMHAIYGAKKKRRILVIGQIEDDKSIKFGCGHVRTNRELLEIAIRENPSAQIIFKNHPDLNFGRIVANSSSISDIEDDLIVLNDSKIGIDDALEGVDHVYAMTSLSGFEALLRGVKASVFGSPFYAGWGLCDDRLFNGKRRKKRSLEEVFACAYMLYPVYFLPDTGKVTTLEEILNILNTEKSLNVQAV